MKNKGSFIDKLKSMSKRNKFIVATVVIVVIVVALIIGLNGCKEASVVSTYPSSVFAEKSDSKTDVVSMKDYVEKSTYKTGDYVKKDGKVYRCTTAVSKTGKFDSAKWAEVAEYENSKTYKVDDPVKVTKDKTVLVYECKNKIDKAEKFNAKNWNEVASGTLNKMAEASASTSNEAESSSSFDTAKSSESAANNSGSGDSNSGISGSSNSSSASGSKSSRSGTKSSSGGTSDNSRAAAPAAPAKTQTCKQVWHQDSPGTAAHDEPVYAAKVVDNYWNSGMTFDTVQAWNDWADENHDGEGTYTVKEVQTGTTHHDAVAATGHYESVCN